MPKINPLLAIAIPSWGKVSLSWAQAYKRIGGPLGANVVELSPVIGRPIAEARNSLMQSAIDNGCDFIFFLGDDVKPAADVIHRLLQRMWDNPDIDLVTGMYWTKEYPTSPYIWRGIQRGPYLDWKYGEFFEVDYAGCDCLMIRLSDEIKALGPDWFSTDWTWEPPTQDQSMILLATEDFYFYTKTRKAGLKLYCDSLVQCIHEDRNSGMEFALTTDMPQYNGAQLPPLPEAGTDDAPLVRIADIGAGYDGPWFGHADRVKIVRFDGDEKTNPDFRCDIRKLPVPDQSFDMVHSRHVLEHFGRADTLPALKEWLRILRVGGEFRLSVPNLMNALEKIALMEYEAIEPRPYPFWQLYGQQKDEYDFHKNGFTPRRVELLLKRMGLEDIEVKTTGMEGDETLNITAKGTKTTHSDKTFALLPEWDAIEKAEGMEMAGLRDREPSEKVQMPEPASEPKSEFWADRDERHRQEWLARSGANGHG